MAAAPTVPVREVFRRFWPYARPYRRWLVLGLAFVVLTPAIDTAVIWMFKIVVDQVLVPRDFGPLRWIAVAYLGLALLSGAASFADDVLSTWIGERFLLTLRTDVFRHLHGLSLDFFERRPLGDLLSRLTGDVEAIENFVLSGVADALSYALNIIFFAGALFVLRWDLAFVSLVVTPFFWVTARRFSRLIKHASREKRRRSGSIGAVAEESLASVPLVQANNRQETEVERFHGENVGRFRAQMASTRLKALFTPIVDLIELAGVLAVIVMGTWELSRGALTLGGLLVFTAYLTRLYSPIRGLGRLSNTIYSASAGAERIIELLEARPSVHELPGAHALPRARGTVEFREVGFRYPDTDKAALAAVSFRLEPGETLALAGASGSGKSTIAKILLRFYDPTEGVVLLDGHDLRDLRTQDLRESVALLLQEALVFDGTVRENIAYGRPGAEEKEVIAAARAADAHDFITALPDGYDSRVGQKGRRLSGGQRQRIAIARAMIRDAPVLVLDEPTTGLDAESGRRVLEALRRLMSDRTTVVISHNLMTVRDVDRILVLAEGRVVERGTHEELMARDGAYARQYRLLQGGEAGQRRPAAEPVGHLAAAARGSA